MFRLASRNREQLGRLVDDEQLLVNENYIRAAGWWLVVAQKQTLLVVVKKYSGCPSITLAPKTCDKAIFVRKLASRSFRIDQRPVDGDFKNATT
jgi:hypothetical protein